MPCPLLASPKVVKYYVCRFHILSIYIYIFHSSFRFFSLSFSPQTRCYCAAQGILRINEMDAEALQAWPGIGIETARSIIERREALEGFRDRAQVQQVLSDRQALDAGRFWTVSSWLRHRFYCP